jgi:hypothetical protein
VGSLKGVIADVDSKEYDSLITATQFSFFPVFLGILVAFPFNVIMTSGKYGIVDILTDCVLAYLLIFSVGFSQKIASVIVRGHGSLRASLTLALFGTAYIPIGNALGYLLILDKGELKRIFNPQQYHQYRMDHPVNAAVVGLTFLAFGVFLIFNFVTATAYVHRVGRFRAAIICILTLLLADLIVYAIFAPIESALLSRL